MYILCFFILLFVLGTTVLLRKKY